MDPFEDSGYLSSIGCLDEPFEEPEDDIDEDFSVWEIIYCRCGCKCKLFVAFYDPAEYYWICEKCGEEY